jgi:hypothetical protein
VTTPESFAAELEPTVKAAVERIVMEAIGKLPPFPSLKRPQAKFGLFLLWGILPILIQAIIEIIINEWVKHLSGVVGMMQTQNAASGQYNPAVDELADLLATPSSRFHPAVKAALRIDGGDGASNGEG